jgi:hypothetical protein
MEEKPDYTDYSDEDLSDLLETKDQLIENYRVNMVRLRKLMNAHMEDREDIIDLLKERTQKGKGWQRR